MHMERKHAKEKSVHASGGSRRTGPGKEDRPTTRKRAGKGGRHSSQAGVDRQAAIYFHPNLNSIFARPLLLRLSLSLTPKSWKTRRCQPLRTSNERASERKSEGREERFITSTHARSNHLETGEREGEEASKEMGGVEVGRPSDS